MITRRAFLAAGGLLLAGGTGACRSWAAGVHEIELRSDAPGAEVWFDPVGLLVDPGDTVRWVVRQNVHTTAAYHPKNDAHSLRIPEGASPWDSGYLVNPGDHFELTLTVPGVYDYFCAPHEAAGMVGRIIAGEPTGPGSFPFDYFKDKAGAATWRPVPQEAQRVFPRVDEIMRRHVVHRRPPSASR